MVTRIRDAGTRKGTIGLALGSGAARGLAHIGVLKVLEREGIPIDMIAGTSMGALIGAFYAREKSVQQIEEIALEVDWGKLVRLIDPILLRAGLVGGRKIKGLLQSIIGDLQFSELNIPFACVATDAMTGEEIVFDEGSVIEAVRASISIPVIFAPARWQDRLLLDGALVNPVPVSVLKAMGADFIIAVNVIPKLGRESYPQKTAESRKVEDGDLLLGDGALSLTEQDAPAFDVRSSNRSRHVEKRIRELVEENVRKIERFERNLTRVFKGKAAEIAKPREPNIFSVIMNTVHIAERQIVAGKLEGADVVVEPHVEHIGAGEFYRARECIRQGEIAAEEALRNNPVPRA